ncbi:DUF3667 domain-containing protein [Runella sp. CRIBMP]|uniref:DUF3667 domain-containing protein n=1 Tax=Runella sp. CRIBMP TaxID=2683261 RepID=UPI0014122E7F|nr:DUF3667 domain-containing protein [Runella sp. CRIBMP]NBB21050.1 DUF3667 domain-containing protein [Runella sp. CRIBMP]
MNAAICKNCQNPLGKNDDFCAKCGQSAHIHRIDMHHIWHDVVHAFVHADKGVIHLTKELALKPGIVVKEYVTGKRKKYYNPFSYLVLTVAISAFLTHYFHLMENNSQSVNPVTELSSKYFNLILFIGVPISSFYMWLLFRKKGYNYAENLTFQAFIGGFRVVFFILIFTPLVLLFRQYYFYVLSIYMLAWFIFTAWAKVQFFGGPKWLTILKAFLVILFTQMTMTLILSMVAYFLIKRQP